MKNVIIIHGCPSDEEKAMDPARRTYDKHWMPWLKEQLMSRGILAEIPRMPHPWAPNYESHKLEFEKNLITEETILIGHSCGAAFLVRWLGESKKTIAKLILVAPWKIADENREIKRKFYNYDIDPTVTQRVGEIVVFTSNDEEEDGKESARIFQEALGGRLVELPNHGHYTFDDMGTEEFPELVKEII